MCEPSRTQHCLHVCEASAAQKQLLLEPRWRAPRMEPFFIFLTGKNRKPVFGLKMAWEVEVTFRG